MTDGFEDSHSRTGEEDVAPMTCAGRRALADRTDLKITPAGRAALRDCQG